MKKLPHISQIVGISWFIVWLVGGVLVLDWTFTRHRNIFDLFLPGIMILWVASLFLVRAAIAAVARRLLRLDSTQSPHPTIKSAVPLSIDPYPKPSPRMMSNKHRTVRVQESSVEFIHQDVSGGKLYMLDAMIKDDDEKTKQLLLETLASSLNIAAEPPRLVESYREVLAWQARSQ